jgi:hypothetical protein
MGSQSDAPACLPDLTTFLNKVFRGFYSRFVSQPTIELVKTMKSCARHALFTFRCSRQWTPRPIGPSFPSTSLLRQRTRIPKTASSLPALHVSIWTLSTRPQVFIKSPCRNLRISVRFNPLSNRNPDVCQTLQHPSCLRSLWDR